MEPSPEVWLVRHGETAWSLAGRHTGRTDLPLTAAGEREAAGLRRLLGALRFPLVLTSPLQRARETCRLAGLGQVARLADDLVERDYGAYEGRTAGEVRLESPGWVIWNDGVPGGETLEQVSVRAVRVIEQVSRSPGPVLLFAHGHVLRILAACWVGLPARAGGLLTLDTASVSVLGEEGGARCIRRWNLRPEVA
jgi:probable phosphoglycerate mutase